MRKENKQNKFSLREMLNSFKFWLKKKETRCYIIFVAGALILLGILCLGSSPERYDLSVGSISHETITATRDVEDIIATEERRAAAANSVEPIYHPVEGASEEVLAHLDAVMLELRSVQQYGATLVDPTVTTRSQIVFRDTEKAYAQSLVTSFSLSTWQATILMRTTDAEFETMVTNLRSAVEGALNTTIREGQISQSISTIRQLVSYKVDITLVQNIVPTVLNLVIKPNMAIENVATEDARTAARQAVEPVMYLQGQNIIVEGEMVTVNQLEMLRSLGLLENVSMDFSAYGGAALLTALSMLVMVLLLRLQAKETFSDVRVMSVIMLVMIITLSLSLLTIKVIHVYLTPVALCGMLLMALLNSRVALSASISMSLLTSGLTAASSSTSSHEMLHLLLLGLVGSITAIRFLRGRPQRVRMLLCGVLVALCNLALMMAIGLLTSSDMYANMEKAIWAMGGAILSSCFAMGLQPVFETAFNLATASKLLELANPNQPLLRRLLIEASGTYHHSIVVANLSEAAAEKIGANPLLARTGAYFHDIGKLKRPMFFKENQMGDNPHDRTDPYVSAAIVTSHTKDGVQLAQKYRLPREIQDIISQHHGATPVMYFYHKALQMANGNPVDIANFRYDGQKPATKEAAIVMLADTIEAAVRSMPDPTPQSIARFIERLVRGKIEDGQLSDCPLSLRDIDGICAAFSTVLNGVFHERIEYPTVNVPHYVAAPVAAPAAPVAQPAPVSPSEPAAAPAAPVAPAEAPAVAVEAPETPAEEAAPVQDTPAPEEAAESAPEQDDACEESSAKEADAP